MHAFIPRIGGQMRNEPTKKKKERVTHTRQPARARLFFLALALALLPTLDARRETKGGTAPPPRREPGAYGQQKAQQSKESKRAKLFSAALIRGRGRDSLVFLGFQPIGWLLDGR